MHPVLHTLILIGMAGLIVAGVSANLADAMADDERRKGLAAPDAPAILTIIRLSGTPVGRWMIIPIVYTDWYKAYRSPYIRYLTYVARVGLAIGTLAPVITILLFLGLDAAMRP